MIFPKDKGFKHEAYGAGDVQALLKDQEIRDQKKQTKLPDVTVEDNGKVLSVVEGNWDKALPTNELPDVTEDDNDKVLKVVDGVWDKAEAGGNNDVIYRGSFGTYSDPNSAFIDLLDNKTENDIYRDAMQGKFVYIVAGGRRFSQQSVSDAYGVMFIQIVPDFNGNAVRICAIRARNSGATKLQGKQFNLQLLSE